MPLLILESDYLTVHQNEKTISLESAVEISAENLVVLSTQGSALTSR